MGETELAKAKKETSDFQSSMKRDLEKIKKMSLINQPKGSKSDSDPKLKEAQTTISNLTKQVNQYKSTISEFSKQSSSVKNISKVVPIGSYSTSKLNTCKNKLSSPIHKGDGGSRSDDNSEYKPKDSITGISKDSLSTTRNIKKINLTKLSVVPVGEFSDKMLKDDNKVPVRLLRSADKKESKEDIKLDKLKTEPDLVKDEDKENDSKSNSGPKKPKLEPEWANTPLPLS